MIRAINRLVSDGAVAASPHRKSPVTATPDRRGTRRAAAQYKPIRRLASSTVHPAPAAQFTFEIKSSPTPGWQTLQEGVRWFGEPGKPVDVVMTPPGKPIACVGFRARIAAIDLLIEYPKAQLRGRRPSRRADQPADQLTPARARQPRRHNAHPTVCTL
ncbi:hypothetical protein ILP97_05165 [Amycolatopsis sp. H6(2020)]|nr:hypothetical protein [Amycolatopsis sp. H6(2020)]